MSEKLLRYFRRLAFSLQKSHLWPYSLRGKVLQWAGVSIEGPANIASAVHFGTDVQVTLKRRVFINTGCHLDDFGIITFDEDAQIGPYVRLITSTHVMGPSSRRAADLIRGGTIHIGRGCWLGAGVMVLPNVTIAPGCMIAAGSVVTKDTLPDGLYAGVPARRIRDLEP